MFNGLEYVINKFPRFMDFTKDSNNSKVANIIHHNFKELYNSLRAVRNGYFFLNGEDYSAPELEHFPVFVDEKNEITLTTTECEVGDSVNFRSRLFGDLGDATLEYYATEGDFKEHIGIETAYDTFKIHVSAPDIKRIRTTDITDNTVSTIKFDYKTHQKYYNYTVKPITHVFKVEVETWDEYTYTSYSNRINTDLDRLGVLVGSKRREYTTTSIQTIVVDFFVNTEDGDDNNHGLTIDKPFKSLRKALQMVNTKKNKIAFVGNEKLVNVPVNSDTIIYGLGKKSVIDADFWIRPKTELTLQNLVLNRFLLTKRSIKNMHRITNIAR